MSWIEENNCLKKEFSFENFAHALVFVDKVGALAEAADHHPDILLHDYKYVLITLTTHSVGAVTQNDRELALQIDNLAQIENSPASR